MRSDHPECALMGANIRAIKYMSYALEGRWQKERRPECLFLVTLGAPPSSNYSGRERRKNKKA